MNEYIEAVLKNENYYSKDIVSIVKKHLKDLKDADLQWTFNEDLANSKIKKLQDLRGTLGDPRPMPIYQQFIFGMYFGWVSKTDQTVHRFKLPSNFMPLIEAIL